MRTREDLERELQLAKVDLLLRHEELIREEVKEDNVVRFYEAALNLDKAVEREAALRAELQIFLHRETLKDSGPTSLLKVQWNETIVLETLKTADWTLVVKMLKGLNSRQTSDERALGATRWHNGVGFSAHDAGFATSLIRWFETKKFFTRKQYHATTSMLAKYRKQLAEIANKEGWK